MLPKPLIICGKASEHMCGYADLVTLVRNIIEDLVFLGVIMATVALMYVGYLLITSGGNPGVKDRAKKMLSKIVWGFFIMIASWTVVYTITSALLKPGYSLLAP